MLTRRGGDPRLPSLPTYGIEVLQRDRLLQRVARADVTEVTAPPGYGKTILLVSWAQASPTPVAWCTLTEDDADPVHFLRTLATAPTTHGRTLLDTLVTPSIDTDLTAFVAAAHDKLAADHEQITLVLDDVHAIATAQSTVQLLDQFVLDAPETLRIVLAGRQAPPLRRERLALQGRLESIGESDLAFTRQETTAVVTSAQPGRAASEVGVIHRSTGGWPAAVRLSTLAVRAVPPPVGQVADAGATERLVLDVLETLDDQVRAFVLDASVDDRVCAPLLDEVRGVASSAQLLAQCFRQGLFLSVTASSDTPDLWYRWHDLFATHVRRVAEATDPGRRRALEVRAAHWWRSVDAVVAVRHALRADRPDLGAEITAEIWPDLVLSGRTETVAELITRLPRGLTQEADLRLAAAFVAATRNEGDEASRELRRAQASARRLAEPERARYDARGSALSLLYLTAEGGSLEHAVKRGAELLRRLEDGPWTPDPVSLTLTRLCLGMGEARLQRDNSRALALLRSASVMAREQGLTAVQLVADAESCVPLIATCELDVAAATASRVLSSASAMGWGTPRGLAPAVGFQGWLAYWKADLDSARQLLSRALELYYPNDSSEIALVTHYLAMADLHAGDIGAANSGLQALRELGSRHRMPSYWPSIISALGSEIAYARGDLADARRLAGTRLTGRQYRLATLSRARILLRLGSPGEAIATLDQVPVKDRFVQIETMVERLRAEALWAKGHLQEACLALDRALECAAPFGLLLPFLVDGSQLVPLLSEVRERGTKHEQVLAQALNAIQASGPGPLPWGERLSPRELAVLRYLATSLTLPEIAAAERISVNTVKSHVSSIYRKLGVTGRRAAVRTATELRIG